MPAAVLRQTFASWPRLTLRGVVDRLAGLDARYRMNHHLRHLDDRMLRDVGVTRAEIAAEIRRPLMRF